MEETKPKAIVRVHRPDLTPEEREKRMELIRRAAVNLVLATERARRQKDISSAG